MAETSRYKDMSNEDFYSVLKQRELDESWTLSQIVEYERRGPRQFDFDIA